MNEEEYESVTAAAAAAATTLSLTTPLHLKAIRPNVNPTQGCIESSMQGAHAERAEELTEQMVQVETFDEDIIGDAVEFKSESAVGVQEADAGDHGEGHEREGARD